MPFSFIVLFIALIGIIIIVYLLLNEGTPATKPAESLSIKPSQNNLQMGHEKPKVVEKKKISWLFICAAILATMQGLLFFYMVFCFAYTNVSGGWGDIGGSLLWMCVGVPLAYLTIIVSGLALLMRVSVFFKALLIAFMALAVLNVTCPITTITTLKDMSVVLEPMVYVLQGKQWNYEEVRLKKTQKKHFEQLSAQFQNLQTIIDADCGYLLLADKKLVKLYGLDLNEEQCADFHSYITNEIINKNKTVKIELALSLFYKSYLPDVHPDIFYEISDKTYGVIPGQVLVDGESLASKYIDNKLKINARNLGRNWGDSIK